MEAKKYPRKENPDAPETVTALLNPTVKQWFFSRFPSFSLPQLFGVPEIHARKNTLISAPTGATKTLTGFLSILNELVDSAEKGILEDKVYAIYISPLKALSNDISKNLREPLAQIEAIAGKPLGIRVGVRTGDTTQTERAAMTAKAPHILITTPESLAILLSSIKFREHLRSVDWLIIDEIHALADNKRGVHLSLSVERLQLLSPALCRIGLSATVSPLDAVAHYLAGKNRPCQIIDVQFLKSLDFQVISPVPDLIETTHAEIHHKTYQLIDELISAHRTTLIFTNTRAATERVIDHLKHKYPGKYDGKIGAHHGSMSRDARHSIEERLRNGELKAVACSTSLELGIDIGYIDLVLCLGSPKSVARFLQRAGRSGHKLHETVKARIIVTDRDDLIECAVLLRSAIHKKIDTIHLPRNALDVLSQHIIGMSLEQTWNEQDAFQILTKSACYETLSLDDFNNVLSYLAGEYAELEDRHVYARIWRENGTFGKRGKLGRVIYLTNLGTIPDETFVTVKVGTQTVGQLDENFVERLKPGDVFVLGGETYLFKYTRGTVAQVTASVNRPPTVPRWASEQLPLSFDLALEIGKLRRHLLEQFTLRKSKAEALAFIHTYLKVDERAAEAIYSYAKEQYDYAGHLPADNHILIERTSDGREPKTIFHTLYGRRVNDCLSRAVALAIAKTQHKDVEIAINDNGFSISGSANATGAFKLLKPDKLELVMGQAIENSEVYKRRFRHCATRSFLILRNYLGRTKRVGKQQVSSMILMSALKRIDQNFCILREAKRECLEDLMDIHNAKRVLEHIASGKTKVTEIKTELPSPFALTLALLGYIDVLRIEDKYEFLRRMHAQILERINGRNAAPISARDYLARAQQEHTELKQKLLDETRALHAPAHVKAELIRIISGERRGIDPQFLAGINERRREIERDWPEELRNFLFTIEPDLKTSPFSYEDFWREEAQKDDESAIALKQKLIEQFNAGAARARLDPQIRYDVYHMIDGDKDGFRKETTHWLCATFAKTVPKYWGDEIAKFLKQKMKDVR
ncbi:ATP-dependent helicase [Candidatus Woesearchaeota archaeon]|nr:MAG: ATP-dependent helicase [Candidatus Woesearchaeota archaeon]